MWITARHWSSIMQILVWAVIENVIGLVVLQANVSIACFSHWAALRTILRNQQLLLHLSMRAICETLIMIVGLIGGEHCAIHDSLCWSNLTTMLCHVVLIICASSGLEWRCMVCWSRLVHSWCLLDHTNGLRVLISWERLAPSLVSVHWVNCPGRHSDILSFFYLLEVIRFLSGVVLIPNCDATYLLMPLHEGFQPLLVPQDLCCWVKTALVQAVWSANAIVNLSRSGNIFICTIADTSTHRLNINGIAAPVVVKSCEDVFLTHIVSAGLWLPTTATTSAAHGDTMLLAQAALTLVLLNHDIDGLLSVVQVELVVLGFLLLLALLPLITSVSLVVSVRRTSASVPQLDGSSLGCSRLGQAVLRSAKDLLLELHLLSELFGTFDSSMILIHNIHSSAITLKEVLSVASRILGWKRLRSHAIQKQEWRVYLSLLIQTLIEEVNPFVILFLQLTLYALILHEL